MRLLTTPETVCQLNNALRHLTDALEILDNVDAPGEIGSMLDLAIHRLEKAMGRSEGQRSKVQMLVDVLEGEMIDRSDQLEPRPNPWLIPPT